MGHKDVRARGGGAEQAGSPAHAKAAALINSEQLHKNKSVNVLTRKTERVH